MTSARLTPAPEKTAESPTLNRRSLPGSSQLISPAWLRLVYPAVRPIVERIVGFDQLVEIHSHLPNPPQSPATLAADIFAFVGACHSCDAAAIEKLRAIEGPLLLTANHPTGGLDFFAMVAMLETIRPGRWKFLANQTVSPATGLGQYLIPVDPLGRGPAADQLNRQGLTQALRHLRQGGCLAAFPAGRVSHRHGGGVWADRDWSPHLLKLAQLADAMVATIHIGAGPSRFFQRLPHRWPRLRLLFLTAEMTRPCTKHYTLRLGSIRPGREFSPGGKGAAQLMADCYIAADASLPRPAIQRGSPPDAEAHPPHPADGSVIGQELAALPNAHLASHRGFELLLVRGQEAPATLQALGLARELTFQAAGQGTGQACDLSPEDQYYHHLLLWDPKAQKIAGAYRIGKVWEILSRHGPSGLYLDHVFKIAPSLYRELGRAYELSRSFVLPEYQRRPDALAGLWKGLGAAAVREGVKTFFGSVTISNAHHPASRALLVEFLRRNHLDEAGLRRRVRARRPFEPQTRYHSIIARAYAGEPIAALSPLIRRIENNARDIPPLLRYYCALGAGFLDFHVEQSFQDALYCLLRVNLDQIPPSYRRKFVERF